MSPRLAAPTRCASNLAGLDAMAQLSRDSRQVIHVVVPRAPGVVQHAREIAQRVGVDASADIRAESLRIRFAPKP